MIILEIKVNDYVRTDTGIIEKLEGIHEQNKTNKTIIKLNKMGGGRYAYILDINSEFAKEFDKNFSRGNIIKTSPRIIDLIEVGDYVNGVIATQSYIDNIKHIAPEIKENNYGIKSIVTKEQFEQMEYKIN